MKHTMFLSIELNEFKKSILRTISSLISSSLTNVRPGCIGPSQRLFVAIPRW